MNWQVGQFLYDITRITADLDRNKNKLDGASICDILTLMYLLEEEGMFETKKANVSVDISDSETRGRTEITEGQNIDVVVNADGTKLLKEMLSKLFPDKIEEIEDVLSKRQERIAIRDYLLEALPQRKNSILKLFNEERGVDAMRRMAEIIEDVKNKRTRVTEEDIR